MNKTSTIIGAIVFVPVLFGSTAWAAENSREAYLLAPDGSIVRSASGDCVHTPAWNAAAGTDCAGATRAAAPAPAVVKTEAAAKPADDVVSAAAPTPPVAAPVIAVAPAPAAVETPAVVAAPAAAPAATIAAPVAAAPVEVKPAPQTINLSGAALFEFDRAELKPVAQKQLSELASKVKTQKDLDEVVISGFADAMGPDAYNEELSKRRAESVKEFLLQQGVVSKRVVIQALGEEKPVASNDTAEGRAQNRRVEVSIRAASSK